MQWMKRVAVAVLAAGSVMSAVAAPAAKTGTAPTKAAATSATAPLDLNTATADQLKALPGIGDAYAKRIIDSRPYAMKNQLTQRGILPQATYDGIKDKIVAHKVAKK